jgi:hypothetical protein
MKAGSTQYGDEKPPFLRFLLLLQKIIDHICLTMFYGIIISMYANPKQQKP